jgi:membrane protein YqaA with SNARE-associated domain
MNTSDLVAQFGPYLATFIFSFLSAVIPVLNLEFYLATVSAVAPNSLMYLTLILFIATFSHMIGKGLLYGAGRGIVKISWKNKKFSTKQIKELQLKMKQSPAKNSVFLFFSGITGLPPFYLVTIIAGTLKINFWNFFICGFAGRLIRLAFVLALPQLIKSLIHIPWQ